jgi:hypothetical protein
MLDGLRGRETLGSNDRANLKSSGDDITMKLMCLVLLISGTVPLIQGCQATNAAGSNLQAASRAAAATHQVGAGQSTFRLDTTPDVSPSEAATSQATDGASQVAGTSSQVSNGTSQLISSASNLAFGGVNIGNSGVLGLTLTNAGNANIAISNVSISGPGFNASGISAGSILGPGQTANMNVSFAPSGSSTVSGTVTITSTAANPKTVITLSGAGTQATMSSITISPSDQTVSVGQQVQFKAVDNLGDDLTSSVVWTSSNPSVVSITPGGLANALTDGPVTISAQK